MAAKRLTSGALVGLLAGLVAAAVASYLMGWTLAIATPSDVEEWLAAQLSPQTGLLLWGVVVVAGPAVGLPLFMATLLPCLRWKQQRAVVAFSVLAGFLLGAYVLVPALYGAHETGPAVMVRPWWSFGTEVAAVIAVGLGTAVARVLGSAQPPRTTASAPSA